VQDVDRVADVESLAQPAGHCRPRVELETPRSVSRAQPVDRLGGYRDRRRHFGQEPAVWSAEAQLAVGPSLYLIALFVDRAVVAPTEHSEIRQRRRAAVHPMTDVMALAER